MIEGGWTFVIAAYVLTLCAIIGLVLSIGLSARRWAKEAKKLDPS